MLSSSVLEVTEVARKATGSSASRTKIVKSGFAFVPNSRVGLALVRVHELGVARASTAQSPLLISRTESDMNAALHHLLPDALVLKPDFGALAEFTIWVHRRLHCCVDIGCNFRYD